MKKRHLFLAHSQMIPIECFEAQSMNGRFVPILPGGGNMKLTFHNRKDYVEKALKFRLHELDQQVLRTSSNTMTYIYYMPAYYTPNYVYTLR